ncbi:RsmB/NOP family class I SAM-dependent RNA methyltransferase [Thioclava atlantica]|uniref:Ribosomal RNA small subunit methyltransferase B n=1 Tax=Thioclava atlantica TaxID=1317124 RepID=A0A085TXG9_9RHOB|nr:RsmB/NOP family class I SAM-dependent RNA methyltransferase [Thioclava atlantica]KFE35416.1 ribosomal RNA small subunit methyltransferase B [Thioclava atlantica]
MTPAARYAAAIDILDEIAAGAPAERCLTNWARAHRFAGSKDRAAIRDHVYDVLRCRGSCAALGGGQGGRALVLGLIRLQGEAPETVFSGERFAPAPLSDEERARLDRPVPEDLALRDWPDWLLAPLQARFGEECPAVAEAMRHRAPVFVRVNRARVSRGAAIAALEEDGIEARPHPLAETALELGAGARRIQQSRAWREGLVELQDASSQAAIARVPLVAGQSCLDYCAGGGGKALALAAACHEARISAHDVDAGRMRDIPVRAERAGTRIALRAPGDPGTGYDLVLVDAPCSGSGTWRRTPEAKWRLTPERLEELVALQARILSEASHCVAPGGRLVYMTCSLFEAENEAQAARFARESGFHLLEQRAFSPLDGGDGFFVAQFERR